VSGEVRAMGEYTFCRVKDSMEPEALRAGGREGRHEGGYGYSSLVK
jgi:hypothetical protein